MVIKELFITGKLRRGVIVDSLKVKRFIQYHACAVCGGVPSYWYFDSKGLEVLVACPNPEHQGLTRLKGWAERWREGEAVPIEVAQNLERKNKGKEAKW